MRRGYLTRVEKVHDMLSVWNEWTGVCVLKEKI